MRDNNTYFIWCDPSIEPSPCGDSSNEGQQHIFHAEIWKIPLLPLLDWRNGKIYQLHVCLRVSSCSPYDKGMVYVYRH